jgi:hypothetical protein
MSNQLRALLKILPVLLSLTLGLTSQSAHADIYGYFDADGNAHFATEAMDPRYKLLMRGDETFDSSTIGHGLPASGYAGNAGNAGNAGRAGHAGNPVMHYLRTHPGLQKYQAMVERAATDFDLEPALLNAIMAAESGFNPGAVSAKGAIGLMQIMPATAERYGLQGDKKRSIAQKLTDPAINIRLAARYLRDLQALFPRRPELVIASYNAGEGAVQKYRNQIPPFPETRDYVQLVSQFYQLYGPTRSLHRSGSGGDGNGHDGYDAQNGDHDDDHGNNSGSGKVTRITMVIPAPHDPGMLPDDVVRRD